MRHASATDVRLPLRVKPRLRGASHLFAFFAALVAGAALVFAAPPGIEEVAAGIYALSLVTLYGTSALYHVPMWPSRPRMVLRRMDHAAIFLLIAGTYTPFCLVALPAPTGPRMLAAVWAGAAAGVLRAVIWVRPPRWLTAGLYVLLGWGAVFSFKALAAAIGGGGMGLLLGGGLIYSLGAVIYARRRPDPFPRVFGYHEIFHLMVIGASALHFVAIARLLSGAG